jgi:hypothetical protein
MRKLCIASGFGEPLWLSDKSDVKINEKYLIKKSFLICRSYAPNNGKNS